MQSALDTVLARASGEAVRRFEELCLDDAEPRSGPIRTSLDGDSEVLRRDFLTHSATGVAGALAVTSLVDVLLTQRRCEDSHVAEHENLRHGVTEVKTSYQACHYEHVLDRLVVLLPMIDAACGAANDVQRQDLYGLAADAYHVAGSVLLKMGDRAMALVAAERSAHHAHASGDPVAVGTSARLMTHAFMSNGHTARAVDFAQAAAGRLEDATCLKEADSVAVYGALLLRAAIAAARNDDREAATTLLEESNRSAGRLGHDGNDRWTGFGHANVLQHRVAVAVALGNAGTAIACAREVPIEKIRLAERKACLFVDIARAYAQWDRREQALAALQTAHRIAPEEIRCRPGTQQIVGDLATRARGHLRRRVNVFAAVAGVRL